MKTAASDRPLIFVLSGARGDLTRRLIMPALFSLYNAGELPREFMLLGFGHGESSDQDFADYCHACVCDHPDAEKPRGEDLDSYREINTALTEGFAESQIFRIDHFLGKETVQNILALRFAN